MAAGEVEERVDLRLGTDAGGNPYIMTERNGVIYRARPGGFPQGT